MLNATLNEDARIKPVVWDSNKNIPNPAPKSVIKVYCGDSLLLSGG